MPLDPSLLSNLPKISNEALFQAVNVVLPAWLLLIVAPHWRSGGQRLAFYAIAFLSLLYTLLLMNIIVKQGSKDLVDHFFTYGGVRQLLCHPDAALLTWFHIVVVDIAAALWFVVDSKDRGIPQFLMVPQIALAMMFAPVALLLYIGAVRPLFSRHPEGRRLPQTNSRDKWE